MTWLHEHAGEIQALAAVVAIVAALAFQGIQSYSLKRSLASTTFQELATLFSEFAKVCIEYPEVARALEIGRLPDDKDARMRVIWALNMLFAWHEARILHREEYRVHLSRTTHEHWERSLAQEFESPLIATYWAENRRWFHPALRQAVSTAIVLTGTEHQKSAKQD